MRRTTFALMLAVTPVYLAAQSHPEGQTESKPASQTQATAGFSAETRVQLEAMLRLARESELPTEPMTDVMAEGQAKGASEVRIIAATRKVAAELTAAQEAFIRAGRSEPSDAEIARGASALAGGATSAQLEAFVRHAPAETRLEVALQVLTDLAARGVPVEQALTVIGARLDGSASAQLNGHGTVGNAATPGGAIGAAGALTTGLGVGLTRKP